MGKPPVRILACDRRECLGDGLLQGLQCACRLGSHARLDLGPALFDQGEIGRIRREIEQPDAERKADDGPQRLVHLSAAQGESALPESTGPTGKRSARKRACSVWSGGKAAKPYLSLPYWLCERALKPKLCSQFHRNIWIPKRIGRFLPSRCRHVNSILP